MTAHPGTIISAAAHAQHVLDLAAKDATTLDDWQHINQLAVEMNRLLLCIEYDDCLRGSLRTKAKELSYFLVEIMRQSCGQVEALGGFGYRKEAS